MICGCGSSHAAEGARAATSCRLNSAIRREPRSFPGHARMAGEAVRGASEAVGTRQGGCARTAGKGRAGGDCRPPAARKDARRASRRATAPLAGNGRRALHGLSRGACRLSGRWLPRDPVGRGPDGHGARATSRSFSPRRGPDGAEFRARLARVDDRLNQAYRALRDRRDATGKRKLLVAQRAWLRYRDAQAAFEAERWGYGQAEFRLMCLERLTTERCLQLETWGGTDAGR